MKRLYALGARFVLVLASETHQHTSVSRPSDDKNHNSPSAVFVVFALAAFVALFVVVSANQQK